MTNGTVERFSGPKGFGFIEPENGPVVSARHSAINSIGFKFLIEGACATFDIEQRAKSPAVANMTAA